MGLKLGEMLVLGNSDGVADGQSVGFDDGLLVTVGNSVRLKLGCSVGCGDGLGGTEGESPPTEAAEQYLNQMANDLMMGQDLSGYTILDRQQHPVLLQAR